MGSIASIESLDDGWNDQQLLGKCFQYSKHNTVLSASTVTVRSLTSREINRVSVFLESGILEGVVTHKTIFPFPCFTVFRNVNVENGTVNSTEWGFFLPTKIVDTIKEVKCWF